MRFEGRWTRENTYFFRPRELKDPSTVLYLTNIYLDQISYSRPRNHIILELLCNFTPQLIIPDDDILEQLKKRGEILIEKIPGITLEEMVKDGDLTAQEFLQIIKICLEQNLQLFASNGIMITDRTIKNVMLANVLEQARLGLKSNEWQIEVNGESYSVYQTDLQGLVNANPYRTSIRQYQSYQEEFETATESLKTQIHYELSQFVASVYTGLWTIFYAREQSDLATTCFNIIYHREFSERLSFEKVREILRQLEAYIGNQSI